MDFRSPPIDALELRHVGEIEIEASRERGTVNDGTLDRSAP
jgi:hypothetical protein